MPTYEYECAACGHRLEEFQSITAAPLRKCPKCGKSRLQRLIGVGAGVIFKGAGFYQTDYRSDSYKAAAKAETSPSESQAKPAAGKESKGTPAAPPAPAAAPAPAAGGAKGKSSGKKAG